MKAARWIVLLSVLVGIAAAQQPTVNQNGTVNASNYGTPNPPGSLVVVFGTNLAANLQVASSTPLSMQLQDSSDTVAVTVNNKPAPIYYVAQNQLSVQLPWGLTTPDSGSVNVPIVVTRNGKSSSPQQIPVGRFSPGIFTVSQNGLGMALAFNGVTGTIAQPTGTVPGRTATPAKAGDHLFVYATGLGPITPSLADGAASCPLSGCPANVKLSQTDTKPVVTVGGVQAAIEFSGLSPQFVGVYQVNFVMPSGVAANGAVPLQIQIGGITTTNKVTIAVQ